MRLLFVLGLLCFVPGLFVRDVWPTVESLYAQVTREMVETGEYVVPQANGEVYSDKPPLFFWMSAPLRRLGLGAQAGRLVSALLACGAMLATAALARLWFSRTVALFAGAILGTFSEFAWLGRAGALDAPLTFWTTLATYGFFSGRFAVFYAAMACGVLTKGPLGVAIPLLAIVAARLAGLPRRGAAGARHVLWGIPLLLGLVAAWVVPACILGGETYAHDLLFRQTLQRAVGEVSHTHPWWWYVPQLPAVFFPWILMGLAALPWAWRRREEPALRAMAFWFVLAFVMFCAISGKRIRYLLPLMPAFAIVVARVFEARLLEQPPVRGALHRMARIQHVILLGAGVAFIGLGLGGAGRLPLNPWFEESVRDLARWPRALGPVVAGLLLGAIGWCGVRAARADRHRRSMALLVAAMVLAHAVVDVLLVARVNSYESPRPVAARIDALAPPESGALVAIFPVTHHASFNLYSRRLTLKLLTKPEEIGPFLNGPGNRLLILERRNHDALPPGATVIEEHRVGRAFFQLVTRR